MQTQQQSMAPNDIAALLPEFKIDLAAENRSPASIHAYRRGVEALDAYLVPLRRPFERGEIG